MHRMLQAQFIVNGHETSLKVRDDQPLYWAVCRALVKNEYDARRPFVYQAWELRREDGSLVPDWTEFVKDYFPSNKPLYLSNPIGFGG